MCVCLCVYACKQLTSSSRQFGCSFAGLFSIFGGSLLIENRQGDVNQEQRGGVQRGVANAALAHNEKLNEKVADILHLTSFWAVVNT